MWRAQGSHPPSRACLKGSNQSFSLPFLLLAESVHGGRRGRHPCLISICLKSPCHCWRQKMETAGWASHSQQQGTAYALLLTRYCREQGKRSTSNTWAMLVARPPAQEGSSTHPATGRRGQQPQHPSSALSQDTSSMNFLSQALPWQGQRSTVTERAVPLSPVTSRPGSK